MAHAAANRKKIVSRIRRLQGQLEAIVRSVEAGADCFEVLQTAAACRGAFAGLLKELLEEHIESHIANAADLGSVRKEAKELTRILRSYLK